MTTALRQASTAGRRHAKMCANPIEDLNSVQGTVLDSMLPASISMQAAFVELLVKLQLG